MNFFERRFVGIFLSSTLLLAGCGSGSPSYSILPTGQSFTQSASSFNNQLDILWVVDNSGSMQPLQTNMVNNFTSFMQNFQTKGYDFKMSVTTTEAYLADPNLSGYSASYAPYAKFRDGISGGGNETGVFVILPSTPNLDSTFVTNANLGANGDGDERAFSSLRTALNSSTNSGFLRASSFFAIIILSDEDDFSSESRVRESWNQPSSDATYVSDHNYSYAKLDTVGSYESYLDTLTQSTGATRRWNASAIAVLDSTCEATHVQQSSTAIIGQRYIQLANDTDGVLGSVCDSSYATALGNIQNKIAELSTQFFLNKAPQPNTIVVTVNSKIDPQDPTNGWTYNSATNSVVFHGSYIPAQGASINVAFVPTTLSN